MEKSGKLLLVLFTGARSLPIPSAPDYGAEGKRPEKSLANYDANYAY